ncbi:MAG: phosphate ABC transporter permease subunit PstC [Burkholderiaceae bacterium]|nr:phosphate ABC transporter permease subunit PstC [Burkholderiaceae bacterium]
MSANLLVIVLLVMSSVGYYLGRRRAFTVARGKLRTLHSLPGYYGLYVAIWCALPALLIVGAWSALEGSVVTNLVVSSLPEELRSLGPDRLNLVVNDIRNLVAGNIVSGEPSPAIRAAAEHYRALQSFSHASLFVLAIVVGLIGAAITLTRTHPKQRARNAVESVATWVLIACSGVAILTTIGIVLSVLFESIRFFRAVPITEFLFGLSWSPQIALRADQVGSSGAFGAVPLFAGTLLITLIAMLVAVPIGLMSAIYLSEYATPRVRAYAKPLLEILAGIPTVVYGFFAALTVAPAIRTAGASIGLDVASESALAAGLVMGIMIIPFVSSLSDDVINAVPQSLRDGALGMGATPSETIQRVIFPAALPGIVGAILLAVSRAIGETMIVVMAAGLAANLTANPFQAVTTVTVQIVTLLVGDQEFDSPKTLAAFALGLLLFCVTLVLNVIALYIVRKYREQYE